MAAAAASLALRGGDDAWARGLYLLRDVAVNERATWRSAQGCELSYDPRGRYGCGVNLNRLTGGVPWLPTPVSRSAKGT